MTPVNTITDVIGGMEAIQQATPESDGVHWFNWLYLEVTRSVLAKLSTRSWNNPAWLARLDVLFARLYFAPVSSDATVAPPLCWQALLDARHDTRLARIQFALAGMNAHISHDLSIAVVQTCREMQIEPIHLSGIYEDYCAINDLLDGLIDDAKKTLLTGLLGEDLPALDQVEDLVAGFGIRAAREAAWTNAEILWHAQSIPGLADRFTAGLDHAAALAAVGLLAPVGV
jgi:hypothetical protein